jgi:endonuclease/exonuclease/phosphatase family metal-dependent hydrolase
MVMAVLLMLVSRVLEPLAATRGRMMVAGIGVACFLVVLPLLLWQRDAQGRKNCGLRLGLGLVVGLSLSILLRALGSGNDISTSGWGQIVGWLLALVAGALLFQVWWPSKESRPEDDPPAEAETGFGRIAGLCLGLVAGLVLCYFVLGSPNVIARWTGASYLLVVGLAVLALFLFVLFMMARPRLLMALSPGAVLAWNILFVAAMVLSIAGHQVAFPSEPGAYPLDEPAVSLLFYIPLFLMLVSFPVVIVDFMLFAQELAGRRPSLRGLGGGFGLASLYLLLMVFAHIFTTVYDYIPVVGPLFRDKFWHVHLVAGLALALPLLLLSRKTYKVLAAVCRTCGGYALPSALALSGLFALGSALLLEADPPPVPDASSLRVLTYNVQQGYSQDGLKNYQAQLDLVKSHSPDIVGLQESDTNRIAGGNSDLVRAFADGLDMYSYYGPETVQGTFGIALLSRYPIEDASTFYMYSEGEQTATIMARVSVGGETFNLFVTHLGNGGPMVQQEALLKKTAGKENVIALGDFNFRPDSDQYQLTTDILEDSWLLKWPGGNQDQGIDPAGRIDHIFVSPGMEVSDSVYLPEPESDHPAMMTTLEW